MSLAAPAALILSVIALPIIALYILKVRLRRIPISTNMFWKQVYDEKPPRSLWQQLRHWLSLLAQLLLLLLLVLSLADPYFSWQSLQARRVVIVLDTSASMRATDIAPSRFDAARTALQRVLDGLRNGDQVAIVSAGSRPNVVLGMAGHIPTLRRALDSVQVTDATSSLVHAIGLAKQLIGTHPHGEVLVFTDGCGQRTDASATDQSMVSSDPTSTRQHPSSQPQADTIVDATLDAKVDGDKTQHDINVQTQIFATAAANVGITQFQARRSLVDPIGYEILVKIRNASNEPIKGRLELELEGIPIDVIPLNLKPDESWSHVIEKTSLEGGKLKASLTQLAKTSDDGAVIDTAKATVNEPTPWNRLTTDDIAWAIVPARIVQNVLIVSPGNLFLQKVFEANPLVRVTVRKNLPEQWPDDTIYVCHRLVPQTLPAGDVLVIDPESHCDLWEIGDAIENPIVTQQDDASALMTHIRMDNVLMPETRRLSFKTPIKSLAETISGDSIYASVHRSQGECLVLSVNLERSDLAFRTAFPIIITNALSYFAGQPGELQPAIPAGQTVNLIRADKSGDAEMSAEAPASDNTPTASQPISSPIRRTLVSPSQHSEPLVSNQIGPLNEVGIWNVVETMPRSNHTSTNAAQANSISKELLRQQIAVNLANANESDLRYSEHSQDRTHISTTAGSWFTRPIWFYLVVVACALSTLEWFLYQRRFIT